MLAVFIVPNHYISLVCIHRTKFLSTLGGFTELENLQDAVKEEDYNMKRFGLGSVDSIPGIKGSEDYGELLEDEILQVVDKIEDKHVSLKMEVDKASDEHVVLQRVVAEQSTLFSHNRRSLESLKTRLSALTGERGSVYRFDKIVKAVRQYETQFDQGTTISADISAQDLSKHLASRFEDCSADEMKPEVVSRIISRLKKLVR